MVVEVLVFGTIRKRVGDLPYLEVRDNTGKNLHALFTAPNPDSRPRITVPTTVNRANTILVVPVDVNPVGKGMKERRKRKSPTGSAVRNSRVVVARWRPCKPRTGY